MPEWEIPVILTVRGRQSCQGMEPEESELTTEGVLRLEDTGWQVSYEETELTGLAGTTTTFLVGAHRAELRRSGTVCSSMLFVEGERHSFRYATPYGSLAMEAETERLHWRMNERGGLLELRYRLRAEGQVDLQSRVCLQIRPKR